jgi:hypothetical protein
MTAKKIQKSDERSNAISQFLAVNLTKSVNKANLTKSVNKANRVPTFIEV